MDVPKEGDRVGLKGSYRKGKVTEVVWFADEVHDKEEAYYFITWDENRLVDPRPYPREKLLAIRKASS